MENKFERKEITIHTCYLVDIRSDGSIVGFCFDYINDQDEEFQIANEKGKQILSKYSTVSNKDIIKIAQDQIPNFIIKPVNQAAIDFINRQHEKDVVKKSSIH